MAVTHRADPRSAKRRKPINIRWETPPCSVQPTAAPPRVHTGSGVAGTWRLNNVSLLEFSNVNVAVTAVLGQAQHAALVLKLSRKTLAFARGNFSVFSVNFSLGPQWLRPTILQIVKNRRLHIDALEPGHPKVIVRLLNQQLLPMQAAWP